MGALHRTVYAWTALDDSSVVDNCALNLVDWQTSYADDDILRCADTVDKAVSLYQAEDL